MRDICIPMASTFPTLFGEASTGKTKQWSIRVLEADGAGVIEIEHGYEGGKLQTIRKTISEGKNTGKKNATNAIQQALSEAQAQWLKKKESGYDLPPEKASQASQVLSRGKASNGSIPSVMLAHDYHKRGKDIRFPCYVQRKLDGTRCVAVPSKGLYSRNKKEYPHLDHILQEIQRLPPHIVLDGELYSSTLTFQEIVSGVKREAVSEEDKERQKQIQFYVYDMICDLPYANRYINLQYLFRRHRFRHLVLVKAEPCMDEQEMKAKHAHYVADGYEGIMLRNATGLYKGVRSTDLQKYKEFLDKEYTVVGFEEGQGLEKGCVLWTCHTEDGKTFSCRPRGSREERHTLFENGADYIGRSLTVRYQEETDDGLPRFPVGIAFRDYE